MDLIETPFRNRDELFGLLTMLHDAACARERIQYDAPAGRLEIVFDRVSFDYPQLTKITRRFAFLRHHELPVVKSRLTIEGLQECRIGAMVPGKRYTFVECEIKANEYTLEFSEQLKIVLQLGSSVRGVLKDLELLSDQRVGFVE